MSVIPSHYSADLAKDIWKLVTASYGLANANSKKPGLNDQFITEHCFYLASRMPWLLIIRYDGQMEAFVTKKAAETLTLAWITLFGPH